MDAALPVVNTLIEWGGPSAIFFETLGERTVALAQLEKRCDPQRGYEPMLERLLEQILKKCVEHRIPIIGNFGAANPMGAAKVIAVLAKRLGLVDLKIGVVHGDDVRERLNLKTHEVYEADTVVKHLNQVNWSIIEGPVIRTGATSKINSVYIRDPDVNFIEISELWTE